MAESTIGNESGDGVRLNPKLTMRRAMTPENNRINSPYTEESTQSEIPERDTDTTGSNKTMNFNKTNPKLHLVHNGKWIQKQFKTGRPEQWTGLWNCCGSTQRYSLYCDGENARESFHRLLETSIATEIEEKEDQITRKKELSDQVEYQETMISKLPEELLNRIIEEVTLHNDPMQKITTNDGMYNAPILIPWLVKHVDEELTILSGLEYLHHHTQTGAGCSFACRHGACEALLRIHRFYQSRNPPSPPRIEMLILQLFQRFLDCNYTRDDLIRHDLDPLHCIFSIAHRHMQSMEHVEIAIRCLAQCSRSNACCNAMMNRNYLAYLVLYGNKYHRNPAILRYLMKLINWFVTPTPSRTRIEYIHKIKGLHFALKCMSLTKELRHRDLLPTTLSFLLRAVESYPPAVEMILHKPDAISHLIETLRILYSDAKVQLNGIKLLSVLAKTSEGWRQISDCRGGWQIICQGTELGDALIHELKGGFHNPGWCIGDTPFLPMLERKKLQAALLSQSSIQPKPSASWTSFSLRQFMGLSIKEKVLAINNEEETIYFNLITTLDLLPRPGEEREDWFVRLGVFEKENSAKISEMVATIRDMNKRESATKQLAQVGLQSAVGSVGGTDEVMGSSKPIFVLGEQITESWLNKSDVPIRDILIEKAIIVPTAEDRDRLHLS